MDNVLAYVTKATVILVSTMSFMAHSNQSLNNVFLILLVRKYKKYYPACLQSGDW